MGREVVVAIIDGLRDARVSFQESLVSGIPVDVHWVDDVEKLFDLFIGEFVCIPHHLEGFLFRQLRQERPFLLFGPAIVIAILRVGLVDWHEPACGGNSEHAQGTTVAEVAPDFGDLARCYHGAPNVL
jgi:hypothetical protein